MQDIHTSFADLGLSDTMINALERKGFETPSPIQSLVIPEFLREKANIIGQAQTGTGKTAAFSIPILETITTGSGKIKALILAPTRELANQVSDEIYSLIGDKKLRVLPVYGGSSIEHQIKNIKRGVDIVVGTPGRIIDLLERKILVLKDLEFFVLDEADEMLNMGFIDDIEQILKVSNPDEQKMLFFSATMAPSILSIAKKYMGQYKILKVESKETTTDLTEQIYFEVRESDKFEALCRVLDFERDFYGIVFARTKQDTNEITDRLKSRGYDADAIHGDVSQVMRNRTLESFKKKTINILVATDVAARGIDVNNLTHVINYSIPGEAESYVHRIGRTGRAGKKGVAITFVTPRESYQISRIGRAAKANIKLQKAPSIDEVIVAKKETLDAIISEIIAEKDHIGYLDIANDLLAKNEPQAVLAALLRNVYNDEFMPSGYQEIAEVTRGNDRSGRNGNRSDGRDRDRDRKNPDENRNWRGNERDGNRYINGNVEDDTRLFVAMGRQDGTTVRSLLEFLHTKAKTPARKVKDVRILDSFSFITVPFDEAEHIMRTINNDKTRKPLISKAKR
ncbi:MAG: box helicase domain protein [Burkholderiales bacterium]|jgi:ATP-dependent RNA helicase DeaD|nr:box helicase domain protein [Burkholderiales bacterium]